MRCRNLVALHRTQAERLGPCAALRYKRLGLYHDLSWQRYHADALACASALVKVGVMPGDRVGLFAENRVEWLLADVGVLYAGAVNVTPHAPLTAKQVQYELADSGVSWLFVSTQGQLDKVLQVWPELPQLRGVVTFDRVRAPAGREVTYWETFLGRGRHELTYLHGALLDRETELGPDSLATIMYTSGTTGPPKGVMLTHGNLVSNCLAVLEASPNHPGDLLLNWLPFSHIYARTVDHYRSIAAGIPLALAESIDTLVDNLAQVRPTHMNSVPRFYEKVYSSVASDDPARTARKLRDTFGGRVQFLSSGGAPLPPAVARAYQEAGLLILQGYGLTESSPVISFNTRHHYKLESVGRAIPGVEVRIAPDGEVLSRGPHIMKGYWKKPGATAETIKDGWLYTGDLGRLDEDGFLSITGRKKEILVLSNGKKVVPSQLENLLLADPLIDQAVICGEGRHFLTALVVPAFANVRAALDGRAAAGDEALAADPAVRVLLERHVQEALKDVSGWEQVKKIAVLPKPFSLANDELTVSLKLRRPIIHERYRAQLDALYRCD